MKKLTLIILLFANSAFSQFKIDEISARKFSLGGFANLYSHGLNTGIEGGIQLPKNWFNMGVAVNPTYWDGKILQNWALNFNYNYFPNSYSNRLDLFFDFNYILGIRHNSGKVYDINHNLIDDSKFKLSNDFNLGLGFNTNISKKLFLKTGFGAGFIVDTEKNYSRLYFSGNIRLALGYRFGN